MKNTLAYKLIEEPQLRVIQIIGEEHTAIAVEALETDTNYMQWFGVKIRDDYA